MGLRKLKGWMGSWIWLRTFEIWWLLVIDVSRATLNVVVAKRPKCCLRGGRVQMGGRQHLRRAVSGVMNVLDMEQS
jgi:hypothetical protein